MKKQVFEQEKEQKIQLKYIYGYIRELHNTTLAVAKKRYKAMSPKEKQELAPLAEKWSKEVGKWKEPKPKGRPENEMPSGNKPYLVSLPMRDIAKLKERAEASGEPVSVLIRAAVRQFLETGR